MNLDIKGSRILGDLLEFQKSGKSGIVCEGGSRCFHPGQIVITSNGAKKISEIVIGDVVPTFNEATKQDEMQPVLDVIEMDNTKPTVKVKLKNGHEIIATIDHKFYFKGGWVCLKDILHLWDERNMETNSIL